MDNNKMINKSTYNTPGIDEMDRDGRKSVYWAGTSIMTEIKEMDKDIVEKAAKMLALYTKDVLEAVNYARIKEALEFYGDESNYEISITTGMEHDFAGTGRPYFKPTGMTSCISVDKGQKARKALEKNNYGPTTTNNNPKGGLDE